MYLKLCNCKAVFSVFYNIFQPNFGILLLLEGSFPEISLICLDKKLVYNANCPLEMKKKNLEKDAMKIPFKKRGKKF